MKKIPLTPEVIAFRKARAARISREWSKANPGRIKEIKKKYLATESGSKKSKEYAASHKTEHNAATKRWRSRNPEKVLARNRAHQKANPSMWAGYAQRRLAKKLSQLHPDHDIAKEKFLHERAATLTRLTGGWKHGVDHIIPLAAGGWHHHDNLQVLPLDLNSSKNDNPLWEHPEYCSWRDVPKALWPQQLTATFHELLLAA